MADKLSERLEAAVERLYENGMDTRDIVDLFRESAELARRVEGFVLVPVEVVEVCWNVIDNLSDPPINDDWARRTADRLIQLLDEGPQEAKP